MNRFRIQWEFDDNAHFGSIPNASTVFGGLAWGILQSEGMEELHKVLDLMEKENALIMSDLYPQGMSFVPLNKLSPEDISLGKKWKKSFYCASKMTVLNQASVDEWTKSEGILFKQGDFFEKDCLVRNRIRRSNEGEENRVMPYPLEVFKVKKDQKFDSILDTDHFNLGELEKYFSYLKLLGIGRKTSIGLGRIKEIKVVQENISLGEGNVVMAMADFIPHPEDPCDGLYKLKTAPGRGLDGRIYPQITRVTVRSLFFPGAKKRPTHLGRCVRVKDNRLLYGLAPILPISLEENEKT